MKKLIFAIPLLLIFLQSCVTINYVEKKSIEPILIKNPIDWDLDECNKILDFYSINNMKFGLTNVNFKPKVFIKAIPYNKITVQAITKKEIIEKRLDTEDYYTVLKFYLEKYTSFTYDSVKTEIVDADSNFNSGYSFNIHFENISDPYTPIFLEDGYSYFFLENMNGDFSRVINVSGYFVEDYFQLDNYLNANIKFSPFSSNGKRLFSSKDLNENYKLVFNGLENYSINLQWNLK
jgi:hypothetical protein